MKFEVIMDASEIQPEGRRSSLADTCLLGTESLVFLLLFSRETETARKLFERINVRFKANERISRAELASIKMADLEEYMSFTKRVKDYVEKSYDEFSEEDREILYP
ncbi:hypothetical protein RF11_04742 [Thelohanellus kitauei]|uniref:Uncharacterized protein n=1 Tax=Thelohanellus kitauei TaxID=669202 RepID=A0A0C2NB08_THEKT|nr:hypothetical protein RF11_04742 [Thelohanellus kitauei]